MFPGDNNLCIYIEPLLIGEALSAVLVMLRIEILSEPSLFNALSHNNAITDIEVVFTKVDQQTKQ